MPISLSRQIHAVLSGTPDALPLDELLAQVDDFVMECSSSEEPEELIAHLEEELQVVYHDVVDYTNLRQGEIFLTVLRHLAPVIPSTSVISWFDLVLRPALREPKLPTTPVNYAKELIIQAIKKNKDVYSDRIENYAERVAGFRKRVFDLYLLDAFNEGSENDILEWAGLEEEERQKRTCWKANLEDVLIKYGQENPEDLFTEILTHFVNPSSRLQLFTLLNLLSSHPSYPVVAPILSEHHLLTALLRSIFLDNSSTLCTAGLTFLAKTLPYFAVYAREKLRYFLPRFLAVLARVLCWKERYPTLPGAGDGPPDAQLERELSEITQKKLHIQSDIQWQRLDMSFNATTSHPPDSRPFFSTLFYLYPSNVLKFLRGPVEYLDSFGVQSPYVESWKGAFDEDEIRRRSENLLREHICHPLLLWKSASNELATNEFWSKYSISRITSEAMMLDIRNLAAGLRARYGFTASNDLPLPPEEGEEAKEIEAEGEGEEREKETEDVEGEEEHDLPGVSPITTDERPRFITPLELSSGKATISLAGMVHATHALKANIDVDIVMSDAQWTVSTFPSRSPSPSKQRVIPPGANWESGTIGHVAQAISALQREVLLLRNGLNFELWVQRENVKHIGRLYQDRVLMKSAEAERQGLVCVFSLDTSLSYSGELVIPVQQTTKVSRSGYRS
ncbi:hypothetical protein P691DRAFT_805185 [Macrolepiota fuliginosa MF-IS2]|uniref:Uncharacterized protein n=1 Tax=Macrolepiota fuliginosa MF-IS2 TaxID=1400762 RepID=A0A9P6C4X3_9AGAR|nr:hypothetical protein P691DRAFT_805185 [Macrolepiota fuliginosa MF-IS2]